MCSPHMLSMSKDRLRAAGLALIVALAAGVLAASPLADGLRGLSLDLLTALRWRAFGNPQPAAASPAVVVALDEETFRTPPFEGTPTVTWTRELGRVLTALVDGGATVVGFDVVFPTSIEQSEVPFGQEIGDTLGARLRGFDRDFLRALALAARANKLVLGEVQHQDKPLLPAPGQRAAVGQGRNIRPLNAYNDIDDVIRRLPLWFTVDGAPVPSLAAELAIRATGAPISPKLAQAGAVPGTVTLNFAGGADDIPTWSFADLHACVAKGDTDFFRKNFAGKVVIIGTLLDVEDRKITTKRFATGAEGARAARCALPAPPAEQTFARDSIAGVYVHATAVNNLIRGDALTELDRTGTGLLCVALAALAAAAALLLGPAAATGAYAGLAIAWTALATLTFRHAVALPLLAPLVASFAALALMVGFRLVVSDKSLRVELARRRAHEAEMASAAAIQRAMLPAAQPAELAAKNYDVHPFMTPAREVGGDLYDIVRLDDTRVLISIGDVCGKGIPAALFMAMTQSVMRMAVRIGDDLSAEVGAANEVLSADNAEGMFTTLFCGVLDLASGALAW